MKKIKPLLLVLISLAFPLAQQLHAQVGINTDGSDPDPSAMLDVQSTSKGVLVPRLSTTERQQIMNPAEGLMVYDSTAQAFYYFNGMGWLELLSGSVPTVEDTDGDTKIQVEESEDEDIIRFDVAGNEAMHIDELGNVGIGKEPSAKLDIDVEILESSTPIDYLSEGDTYLPGSAWQSFTATCNCPLISIQISFQFGSSSTSMRIYEGEGTAGNVLHTGSSQAIAGSIITYAVSNVNLVAGNIYTIWVDDNIGGWDFSFSNPYSGGRASSNQNRDHAFSVTVLTDSQDVQFTDNGLVLGGYTLPYTAGNEGQVLEAGAVGAVSWGDKTINTDNQTLSFDGANLSIADGNTVDISTIDTDDQTLSFDGANLSITDGNTVDISTIDTDTDDQTLTFDGANLTIADGNTVDISTVDTDTDDQTLAFDGTNLTVSEGNTVDLSAVNSVQNVIQDTDGDTQIQVEESTNEDKIRFDVAGTEALHIDQNGNVGIGKEPSAKLDIDIESSGETILNYIDEFNGNINTNAPTWQSFISTCSCNLSAVQVNFSSENVPVYIRIREGQGNNGNLLYTGPDIVQQRGINTFEINDVNLIEGNQYSFVIIRRGRSFSLFEDSRNPYPEGQSFFGSNTDLAFALVATTNYPVQFSGDGFILGDYTLPYTAGSAGQVLKHDGTGTLAWATDVDTDDQTLTFDGANLSIADGNTVDISTIDTDTDDQTLAFDGANLSISEGNTVDISTIDTDTDDQTLAFDGANLSISEGNIVDISTVDTDTDEQTLSYDQATQNLSISGGNSVILPNLDVPVGTIIMWIGDENETVPAGWLVCDDRLYDTNTYADLFALLGSNRTPNFLGRFAVGAPRDGINGATAISVGGSGGDEDRTLDLDNIPPHTHSISYREGSEGGSGSNYSDIGGTSETSSNTSSAGNGESFKIMPPFLGVQFLIRAE